VLHELHISGLGVVEDLDLALDPGLNVLTGETGAGKTMVTVGLALALGRRASASLVRPGAPAARVQARFDATPPAVEAGWSEEGELVLARTVSADGRSTARIGGQLAPVSALAELGAELVELHGQHEGLRLLSAGAQTAFLDRFAGGDHGDGVAELRREHERLRSARARLSELVDRERDRERELDLLAYQVREIESAAPRTGELSELEVEETRLAHAERLLAVAASAEAAIGADGAATDALAAAAADLRGASELDPRAGDLAARAGELETEAAELARDLREYRERLELDPSRLEEVRERLAALRGLLRKYGEGEAEVLAYLEEARSSLGRLAGAASERERLEAETAALGERVTALALAVSQGRAEAAPRLGAALEAELRELGMPGAEVEVALVPSPEVTATGVERVELVLAGGEGQPRLPFAKVASGGELSRTMLACRSVLVDLDAVGGRGGAPARGARTDPAGRRRDASPADRLVRRSARPRREAAGTGARERPGRRRPGRGADAHALGPARERRRRDAR
jgi:DNA repair protein RecN (Recombination protein N)